MEKRSGGDGNGSTDTAVAVVALLVSVVALLITFMQALQQYYASAQGYSQCNEKVMGGWAKTKKRTFQWEELRFEVLFDAPVIFLSPPKNIHGPIKGEEIIFLDGTPESLDKSYTTSAAINPRDEYHRKTERERIHTADNERASWFGLLCILQQMEEASRKWQDDEYDDRGPPGHAANEKQLPLPKKPPSLREHHTLTAAVQRKRKSWDTIPPTITKPYATTTMCHLIEMVATLGVYWKEFDRKRDRYWGEGNGLLVLGERVSDLGITFSFQVSGQSRFAANRVIPVDDVKELCFGHVPTIYRDKADRRRLEHLADHDQSLRSLVMSSRAEIAETLTAIGCNQNTVHYFSNGNSKVSHLFPVSFEVIGMLSRTFHIEHSGFTFIPNPTPDVLDKRALSLGGMMASFEGKLIQHVSLPDERRNNVVIQRILKHIRDIKSQDPKKSTLQKYQFFSQLHLALDDCDEILTGASKKERGQNQGEPKDSEPKDSEPKDSVTGDQAQTEAPDPTLLHTRMERRRKLVQNVLRHHLQEVLHLLNQGSRMTDGQSVRNLSSGVAIPGVPSLRGTDDLRAPATPFESMNVAGPGERPERFMDVYFDVVRPAVAILAEYFAHESAEVEPVGERVGPDAPLASQLPSCDDIWCTLVFRMNCWLMLHNFDRNDIQLSKSELLGSRMPVYIS